MIEYIVWRRVYKIISKRQKKDTINNKQSCMKPNLNCHRSVGMNKANRVPEKIFFASFTHGSIKNLFMCKIT